MLTIAQLDYTACLDASHPLTLERTLNQPTLCRASIVLPPGTTLPIPTLGQPLTVTGDDGTIYFTGHIAFAPTPACCGPTTEGPVYRLALQALSDEALLDQTLMPAIPHAGTQSAAALVSSLLTHAASSHLPVSGSSLDLPVATFSAPAGTPCTHSLAQLATQLRSVYSVQNGQLTLTPIPAAVHTLDTSTLNPAQLALDNNLHRPAATDITVCGPREPAAYITEIFQGDGVTSEFFLSTPPFFLPASQSTLLAELFDQPAIDTTRWSSPASAFFTLTGSGLAFNGGTGVDGQTRLTWIDPIEMGGTLLLEASGLSLNPASTGLLAAFCSGPSDLSGCVAGFQATAQQGTGAVALQPVLQGCASGPAYTLKPGCQYTLRLRLHCPELQRTLATYRTSTGAGPLALGGDSIPASALITFEIQEFLNGVASMPITLCEGSIPGLPAACSLVAASSLNLQGSLRALRLTHLGSAWVVTTPPNGGPYTRRLGSLTASAECTLDRSGKLAFYTGFTPAVGERITVTYRPSAPAIGRAADPTAAPAPLWIGSLTSPAPRSSADCRNAAAALLAAATPSPTRNPSLTATYRTTNFDLPADIFPGNALALNAPSAGLQEQLVVRSVQLTLHPSVPTLVDYEIACANDWATDLALHTSAHLPSDAPLPAPVAPTFAPAIGPLPAVTLTGHTVTLTLHVAPPPGGGFEVRRRDHTFLPGNDPDLVLRGSQPTLTWTRQSATESFYLRAFDASTPPRYSEFSSALLLTLPLGE